MGFVALSNRFAMFADGITFARQGMLGVGCDSAVVLCFHCLCG